MMDINIEEMKLNDLEAIKDILASDFDDFWNYNILKEELQNENSKYLVAKLDMEIVGFSGIKVILDEADIMNIVTKKAYRGKGIGTLLLKSLIMLCNKYKVKYINLEVYEGNKPAIHLYEKSGFKVVGHRKNYYKNKTAILMIKEIFN